MVIVLMNDLFKKSEFELLYKIFDLPFFNI